MTPCSALASAEPLAGSAPHTRGWLVLEHPGPWGRIAADALGQVGPQVRQACLAAGITLLCARRPRSSGQRAWLAMSGRMVTWPAIAPEAVLDLDWDAIAAGSLPAGAEPAMTPALFVCTNGKRDQCCAQFGRPVAQALIGDGLAAWECSHIGGHRFAPTAVLLPFGSVHGRLTIDGARNLLAAAQQGRCDVDSLRGLSHLPQDAQAADIAVRRSASIDSLDHLAIETSGDETQRECTVRHPDGRTWSVTLRRVSGGERPESCGKEPLLSQWWAADSVAS